MNNKFINLLFASVGFVMIIGSFYLFFSTLIFVKNSIRADATVTELVATTRSADYNKVQYVPMVKFKTINGKEVKAKSNVAFSGSNALTKGNYYKVGDKVVILYNLRNPENVKIDTLDRDCRPFYFWANILLSRFF